MAWPFPSEYTQARFLPQEKKMLNSYQLWRASVTGKNILNVEGQATDVPPDTFPSTLQEGTSIIAQYRQVIFPLQWASHV